MLSTVFAILLLLLYLGAYPGLNLFFPDGGDDWWRWRMIVFTFNICVGGWLALMEKSRAARFLVEIFIGICFSDVIDRVFFDERHYELNDIVGVIAALAVVYWRKRKELCQRKT